MNELLKFLVDTQLPPKLSLFIKSKGYDSKHTTDYSDGHLFNDTKIKTIAIDENRIIVTEDKDFFDSFIVKGFPPKVLLIDLGNIKNDVLIEIINNNIKLIVDKFESGAGLIVLDYNKVIDY